MSTVYLSGYFSTLSQISSMIRQLLEPVGFSGLLYARGFSNISQLELALVVSKAWGQMGNFLNN